MLKKTSSNGLQQQLLRFLFPRDCLHCFSSLQDVTKIFCPLCIEYLIFLESNEEEVAGAFENLGPAKSLSGYFEQTFDEHVLRLIVSCLLVRHENLHWKLPDYITFVPSLDPKKNSSKTLAKGWAKMLRSPCLEIFEFHIDKQVYDERGLLYTIQMKRSIQEGSVGIICNVINQEGLNCLTLAKTSGIRDVFLLGFVGL